MFRFILILSSIFLFSGLVFACPVNQINPTTGIILAGELCTELPPNYEVLLVNGTLNLTNQDILQDISLEILPDGAVYLLNSSINITQIVAQSDSLYVSGSYVSNIVVVDVNPLFKNAFVDRLGVTEGDIVAENTSFLEIIAVESTITLLQGFYSELNLDPGSRVYYYDLVEFFVKSDYDTPIENVNIAFDSKEYLTGTNGTVHFLFPLYLFRDSGKSNITTTVEFDHPVFRKESFAITPGDSRYEEIILQTQKNMVPSQESNECGPLRNFCTPVNPIECGVLRPRAAGGDICQVRFVVNATDNIPTNPRSSLIDHSFFFFVIAESRISGYVPTVLSNLTVIRIVE